MIVAGFDMNSRTDSASLQAALAACGQWLLSALAGLGEHAALLAGLNGACGGELLRVDLAQAARLGGGHTWRPALPIVRLFTVTGGAA